MGKFQTRNWSGMQFVNSEFGRMSQETGASV